MKTLPVPTVAVVLAYVTTLGRVYDIVCVRMRYVLLSTYPLHFLPSQRRALPSNLPGRAWLTRVDVIETVRRMDFRYVT